MTGVAACRLTDRALWHGSAESVPICHPSGTDLTFAKIGAPTSPTLPPVAHRPSGSWPCIQTEKKVYATALTMAFMSARMTVDDE